MIRNFNSIDIFDDLDTLEHLDIRTFNKDQKLDNDLIKKILSNNKNLLSFMFNFEYVKVSNHKYCNK